MRSDRNIENDQIKKPEGHTCKKMQKEDLLLYAVTDRHWLNGETLYSQVEKTLEGGTTFVQLREKELDEAHFLEEAKKIKELCDRYHVPFVINDNVDIALEIDADGVHVGQSDMEAGDVRAKLGPDKIIGVSAQTVGQALLAQERGADYLGVGAVFHTDSKADAADISHETLKAITEAMEEGINIPEKKPTPPDSIFSKAIGGWYDIVVAMYHDQGHIPLKVEGFKYNKDLKKWDAVSGINVTLGIPIIRVSVDHGTGFDLAGTGECNQISLVNSIDYAIRLAENR